MTIDYTKPGKVCFSIPDYIDQLIDKIPEALATGVATSPTTNHLFNTNDDAPKLSTSDAVLFHHPVAKLLYLASGFSQISYELCPSYAHKCNSLMRMTSGNSDDACNISMTVSTFISHWRLMICSSFCLVGGCISCISSQLSEPHRSSAVPQLGCNIFHIIKIKTKHSQFD